MSTPLRKVGAALGSDLFTRANLRLLGGLAIVGVLGLLGGFAPADSDVPRTPLAAVRGEPHTVDPVEIVLTGRGSVDYFGESIDSVLMTVTNTGSRPVGALDLAQILAWDGQEQSTYADTQRADTHPVGVLNPGVPVDIALHIPAGDAAVLVLRSVTWRESNLDGSEGFFDPSPVLEVTL